VAAVLHRRAGQAAATADESLRCHLKRLSGRWMIVWLPHRLAPLPGQHYPC
jgi:hypothetical protein